MYVHKGLASHGRATVNVWQAIILGVVEGITEYLPVSSTGHLIIASALLGLDDPEIKPAVDTFTIVIQGGAILAVLGLYWSRVVQMLRGVFGRDHAGLLLAVNIGVAFLPAAVLGVMLSEMIERWLFHPGPVIAALMLGGVYMIVLEAWRQGRFSTPRSGMREREGGIESLTPGKALFIGLMQCVAMWPGTSRSMMTITGGVMVGLRPAAAAEFSFLLGLPTLGGACVYKLLKDFSGEGPSTLMTLGLMPVLVGMAVATLAALVAVRWLVGFLNKHGLTAFGVYRLIVGMVLAGLVLGGVMTVGEAKEPSDADAVQAAVMVSPATDGVMSMNASADSGWGGGTGSRMWLRREESY